MMATTLPSLVAQLGAQSAALAALGAAVEQQLHPRALTPELAILIRDAAVQLGISSALADAAPGELRALLGEVRLTLLSNLQLLFPDSHSAGWTSTDERLLAAAGEVSSAFPARLRSLVEQLDGLDDALSSPGAMFLDVGVGVAAMAVEMARSWPSLRVVGLDPCAPALALARARVRALALEHRIELRQQTAQQLTCSRAYDLAWLPSAFVPAAELPMALRRVWVALRPGGYLLLAVLRPGEDALADTLTRLRAHQFGGSMIAPAQAESLLTAHGFRDVRALASPGSSRVALVVGRVLDRHV